MLKNTSFSTAALVIALGCGTLAFTSVQASARGGMGGGAMTNAQSSAHISAQGRLNSNGVNATDRDTGHARAEDRMSARGLKHNKAGIKDTDDVKASSSTSVSVKTGKGK